MSHGDTIPLQSSSQSDIDEIESLINLSAVAAAVPPATRPTDVPASIPVSVSSSAYSVPPVVVPEASAPPPPLPSTAKISSSGGGGGSGSGGSKSGGMAPAGFGGGPNYNTLTEPVWETVKRDVARVGRNVRTVVFPNPFREDPGRALRDWDLWGPFVFILVLGVAVSYAASADKSKVFAVVYAVLAVGAVVLTLNVLLLGGHIIFFQSLSLLGYCLFPLDIGAVICMFQGHAIVKAVIVAVTLAWSSWAAYPFMSAAVPPNRKALAIYPVFLLYISIAFFIFAV